MSDENVTNTQTLQDVFGSRLQVPAFESASTDYRNAQYAAYIADADALAVNELTLLQGRSRHAARNNALAFKAEDTLVTKLGSVGVKWFDKSGNPHTVMQELWDEFWTNPCTDGRGNGNVLQTVWNHDRIQSGEAISRMVIVTNGNTNRIKLKIQPIESEYLDIGYMGQLDTDTALPFGTTRYGITFNDYNTPLYYHFFKDGHFGIAPVTANNFSRVKVDARDIIHIFERTRSNQWRGIPIIAPILSELYSITDLKVASVDKQKAAAAIAWIIEQNDLTSLNAPGSVKTAGTVATSDPNKKIVFTNNGGTVQYTSPGQKFNLVQSSDIGNNLMDLIKGVQQVIASAYNIPYYMLSGDTDALSFSSIRGLLIQFRDKLEFIHKYINIPEGLDKVTARFKAIAQLSYPVSDAVVNYQFPRNYGVDELKDAQADLLELQIGATTLERIQTEREVSMDEVLVSREKMKANGMEEILTPPNAKVNQNTTNGGSQASSQTTGN